MEIGKRIKQARKVALLSQAELALKVGVSLQTISRWETGKRSPTVDDLQAIAKALEIQASCLLSDTTLLSPSAQTSVLPPQTAVPVFDVSVGCGPDGWQPEDAQAIAVEYFDEDKVRQGSYALRAVGNSLEGDGIMEGDIVLVNPYQGEDIKPEWIMYVIYDGVPMLKHVIYHRSGAIELRGANPKESPRLIPPEMATDYFTICGRVVSLKRNF